MLDLQQIIFLVSIFIVFFYIRKIVKYLKFIIDKIVLYRNYEYVDSIVEQCKKRAYIKVFNEDIMINTINGFRVNKNDIDNVSRKYIDLVFLYAGNNIIDDLVNLHGNKTSVIASMTSELVSKIIDDEVEMFSKRNSDLSVSNGVDNFVLNKTGMTDYE